MLYNKNMKHTKLTANDVAKKLGISLPPLVAPFFKNHPFTSEADMATAIMQLDKAFKNEKNVATIASLTEFFNLKLSNRLLPLYGSAVSCGFTSPAEDHVENQLSLDDYLVPNPDATFFVRASGDSMTGAGIHDGDLLIIDRSIEVKPNHIVLAVVDTEFTIKRMVKENDQIILKPENKKFKNMVITSDQNFMVWGVVVHVIHHLK